ncbi:hypothetical protein NDU88_000760 [Pleurodeles waltl]|uniref:Uncharacterized protein n=1 Tax=Pleurodeles waltl TaxID=8319 RepID=A0AAV7KNM5_PLEWA|nr:hypothetical protein NDU88_000760 [Pleurodeles waltl]
MKPARPQLLLRHQGARGPKYLTIDPPPHHHPSVVTRNDSHGTAKKPRATIKQRRAGRGPLHHTSDRGSASGPGRSHAVPKKTAPCPAPPLWSVASRPY